jgi:hypothetical protein
METPNTMPRDLGRLTDGTANDDTAPAVALLLLLISADIAFIVLHLVNVETGWFRGVPMSLEADHGLPETFQYIKTFWIAVCMAAALVLRASPRIRTAPRRHR